MLGSKLRKIPFPALDGLCFTDLSGLRLAGTFDLLLLDVAARLLLVVCGYPNNGAIHSFVGVEPGHCVAVPAVAVIERPARLAFEGLAAVPNRAGSLLSVWVVYHLLSGGGELRALPLSAASAFLGPLLS